MSRIFDRLRGIFSPSAGAAPSLDTLSKEDYFRGQDAWTPITSSNVHSIAFYGEGPAGTLGVRFRGKKNKGMATSEYEYRGVTYEVYAKMIDASSKGSFVWTDLRGRYGYTPIWKIKE